MTGPTLLSRLDAPAEQVDFVPARAAGLARLDKFASRCGRHYAQRRNYDFGPDRRENVSGLSPWIRHRLITEEEVLRATLARHTPSAAEKFVQEVFWRSYFKGWLEHHPSVWRTYQSGLVAALGAVERQADISSDYAGATTGQTGIACFDHWVRELVETGYLHNHTRMWFASIWIFTLRLPWELGADFFLRHLIDGDPASNTLSWRWVGGLHTKGKTYLARPSNIEKYTEGRFRPHNQLAGFAEPLIETDTHPRGALDVADTVPEGAYVLLVTEEDMGLVDVMPHVPEAAVGLAATPARSPLMVGTPAATFASGALRDALTRIDAPSAIHSADEDWIDALADAAQSCGTRNVVTAWAPVGPVADLLARAAPRLSDAGLKLHRVRRPYDSIIWPHATRGFFALRKKIPWILQEIGLADSR